MDMERIRVLHLGSPTGLYGAERWILALVKHLPADRVESWVGVIKDAPDLDAPLCRQATKLGIGTQLFEAHGRLSLAAIGQIRHFMRERGIRIVHTHGYKTDIIGRLAATGSSCKTVATPHGWGASPGIRLRLYEALDRIALRHIDAVAPLSAGLLEGLRKAPGMKGRLQFIPNGVDLTDVDSPGGPNAFLESRRTAGETIVGYVGRLDKGKRLDTLIRAFGRLEGHPKHLCIVGEGPERAELERLAGSLLRAGEFSFPGFREDRMSLLAVFDIFVLPSEHEGLPRCLLEAMSAGVAAIATEIPGCLELIDGGSTGLLFHAGDELGLAQQITRLVDDPALRIRIARQGREHVRSEFSARTMADRYLALYERLVGRPEVHHPERVVA